MKKDKNIIVFDIETQNTFMDVGRGNFDKLLISVVVAYSYKNDTYKVYTEDNIYEMLSLLKEAELVVGFNIKKFDYPVLESYFREPLDNLPTLDILEEVYSSIGRRIKLDYIAEATLGNKKLADGLKAVEFWHEGKMEELIEYCKYDVKLTKELYEYGAKYGYLLYKNFDCLERIPIFWQKRDIIKEMLEKSFKDKRSLKITYSASSTRRGAPLPDKRAVDIYHMDERQIVAFCHLRNDLRTFNIRKILDAEATDVVYRVPESFNIDAYKKGNKLF